MTQKTAPPLRDFLAFKYWPTWIGLGLLSIIAYLPFYCRLKIGSALGHLLYWLARERRYITQVNFELCFPELNDAEKEKLSRKCFRENGIGFIETITGWVRGPEHFQSLLTITGAEHMDKALAKGKGVLLLGAHYTTLDFSANLLSHHYPFGTTYRPHKNPLFDAFMLRGRLRNCNGVFDRKNIRGAFRHLRKGLVLWYAPDQDYGAKHSIYAPFFGVSAATITAASRFASFNDSATLLIRHHRQGDNKRYEIEFIPFPESFPSNDLADAQLINKTIEDAIRVYPEQYLWMHKRFKTQVNGKVDSPYIDIKTSNKKVSFKQFNTLTENSESLDDDTLRLNSGKYLRLFPNSKKNFFGSNHPAIKFDSQAKKLRLKNIASITPSCIFKVPEKSLWAVSYYPGEGTPLDALTLEQFPLKELAALFSQLHRYGFQLKKIKLQKLLLTETLEFNIQNPEDIKIFPSSLSYLDRYDNLLILLSCLAKLGMKKSLIMTLLDFYLESSNLERDSIFCKMLSYLPDRALVNASSYQPR